MLKKSELPSPPQLKQEVVHVKELAGDVLVRGMMLKDRLAIGSIDRNLWYSAVLAYCVFVQHDEKDTTMVPLYSIDEWERWGTRYPNVSIDLVNKALSLSDFGGEEAEKNSKAQKSASPVA